MKITKKEISQETTLKQKANRFSGKPGLYRVVLCIGIGFQLKAFETDLMGKLFVQSMGLNDWIDTGLTVLNKKEFVQSVYNYIQ